MRQKVAIVTDSIACLTRELVEQYQVRIVPVNFYANGRVYKDWNGVTPSEAYQLFLKDPESFRTSAASPADYFEVYRELGQRVSDILCVTTSSKLSTEYDSARVARERARAELPQVSIEVVDSETATAAEGFIALAAARAAARGKSLAEVTEAAMKTRDEVTLIAFLDTVRYVYRTGRVPRIATSVGAKLNIRPIFTISSGVVCFKGMVRSRQRGIDQLICKMRDKVGQDPVHIAVMHAYAPDEAEKLKERVAAEFNCAELWVAEFSPLMGYATGTGTLGLAFYKED